MSSADTYPIKQDRNVYSTQVEMSSFIDNTNKPGPYYPLGTIGTVPRAYDILRAYEGTKGGKNKIMTK
jgi:hypothetical protein